jgi:uncharacterized protein YbjQ (UPF0145 family)
MKKFPVSTTNLIDGYGKTFNVGFVSSHVVAGTNLFSDMFASVSDVFGGRSETYRNQLASIKKEAIDELILEAKKLGGDALVGVSVDFDEISGGNKSMFMVTAVGTAVKLEQANVIKPDFIVDKMASELSSEELRIMRLKADYLELNAKGSLKFTEEELADIIEYEMFDLCVPLLEFYKNAYNDGYPSLNSRIVEYSLSIFKGMKPSEAEKIIYSFLGKSLSLDSMLLKVCKDFGLVDYDCIAKVIQSAELKSKQNALHFIMVNKNEYKYGDIAKMEGLLEVLSTAFPPLSEVMQVKTIMGSKSVWKCVCGCENSEKISYCTSCKCDIFGFKSKSITADDVCILLKKDVEILKNNLTNI